MQRLIGLAFQGMGRLRPLGVILGLLFAPLFFRPQVLLGVYYGNQGWAIDELVRLENWQGKRNAIVNLYTSWTEKSAKLLFEHQLPAIWDHGSVPLISWEPFLDGGTPDDVEARIAHGGHDAYIDNWGLRLKQFLAGADTLYGTADDRRVYVRLAQEPNGNWYLWSARAGANTPADYVSMWQRVRQRMDKLGLDNAHLQWVWTANNVDIGTFTAEEYYPGDAYVDWVGMDGYNWGGGRSWSNWQTPEEVFGPMRLRLTQMAPRKPLALTEVASTAITKTGINVAAKDEWIRQLSAYLKNTGIRMVIWFNEDKETNWQMFAGEHGNAQADGLNVYLTYRAAAQDVAFIPADATNLRLLTDPQFQGDLSGSRPLATPQKTCQAVYTVSSRWSGGYVANVSMAVNYSVPKNWVLKWHFAKGGKIASSWNAQLQQTAAEVSVTPPDWWQFVPAGSTPAFGFVGEGDFIAPSAVRLNGVPCDVVVQ